MLGKTEKNPQLNLLEVPLVHILDSEHELFQLAKKINWEAMEKDFAEYYSTTGAPSVPLRIMLCLNMLKLVFEVGDKAVLDEWLENPYWQYFSGEVYFKHQPPCSVSEFNHFRKRIGKDGEDKIKKLAISTFGKARIEKGIKAHERRNKGMRTGWAGLIKRIGFKSGN
jgi:transposase, IS5 family